MKKSLSIIAVLALATACIYPYQPDLEDAPEGVLVVDGSILPGEQSVVRIGYMTSLWPKKADPDDGPMQGYLFSNYAGGYGYGYLQGPAVSRIWAEDDAGGVYEGTLSASSSPSLYEYGWSWYNPLIPYTLPTENAPTDRSYRLCITAGDRQYSSDWIKPLAPPVLRKIDLKMNKAKTDVQVLVSLDGGSDATGYALLSFDETWRFHADYYPNFQYDPATNSVTERYFTWERYWCWKHADSGTQTPVDFTGMSSSGLKEYPLQTFSRYDSRNHQRYSIRVKARTIDKNTYKYLKHLEESLEAGDNLFTPNPGELAGNMRCETDPDQMVLGYVTVAISSSMRAFSDMGHFLLSRRSDPYALVYPDAYPRMPEMPCWPDYYKMGYMPVEENTLPEPMNTELGPYGWAALNCYDCIAAGGTQARPDFWEN